MRDRKRGDSGLGLVCAKLGGDRLDYAGRGGKEGGEKGAG